MDLNLKDSKGREITINFHGQVINNGTITGDVVNPVYNVDRSSLPPDDMKVKQAIEELYAEKVLTNDNQWYAIKRVLVYKKVTSQKVDDFLAYVDRLKLEMPIKYNNENVRKVPTRNTRLAIEVTGWCDIQEPTDAESSQIIIAKRLLERLA